MYRSFKRYTTHYLEEEEEKGASGRKRRDEELRDLDLKSFVIKNQKKQYEAQQAWLKSLNEKTRALLLGNIDGNVEAGSKIVRIFTSSTFTDTRHERNSLMKNVYGKLKELCKKKGYDFQVVDMRWGIRHASGDAHMTTDICLREIQECKNLSIGPFFVVFLSHKYGEIPLQRVISTAEYDKLIAVMTKIEKCRLQKWYKLDENIVPPAYVLQPISSNIPNFSSKDKAIYEDAQKKWRAEKSELMDSITRAAARQLDPKNAKKYTMSVTEQEILEAMPAQTQNHRCFWFHRVITDIDEKPSSTPLLDKYKDFSGGAEIDRKKERLLTKLKKEKLFCSLPPENIKSFKINWSEKAVDPDTCEEHRIYIEKLCTEFEKTMEKEIDKAISNASKSTPASKLCSEVKHHAIFCNEKCLLFYGREKVLKEAKEELQKCSTVPYVIYGNSGCGKTSLLAKIATQVKAWLGGNVILVLRFIGTTPESSSLRSLLLSATEQIKAAYGLKDLALESENMKLEHVLSYFLVTLRRVSTSVDSKTCPLVIVFDSLDQLSNKGNPRALNWIPNPLPENVYFILSTLPDSEQYQYGYLPRLRSMFENQNEGRLIQVPEIPVADARGTVQRWLENRQRSLTTEQMEIVISAFSKCKLPLFLKLCFDEACRWSSFEKVTDVCLKRDVRGAINAVYTTMEEKYGQLFTSRVFAYITASKNGLSEVELEDILSCDDEVLNDLYEYWTPTIRRLPPLLLVRLKADASQYLVERGSGGVKVIYWYHRQFVESAYERYLGKPQTNIEQRKLIHRNIAEYFLGKWENENKPFLTKKGEKGEAYRFVTPQPLKMGEQYNLRKLEELPLQLVNADMFTEYQSTIIMNLEWHLAKLDTFSYRELLEDIDLGISRMEDRHDVSEWKTLKETLMLSLEALLFDTNLLPSQILGRVREGLYEYREQCRNYKGYALFSTTPTLTPVGGDLRYCLGGHAHKIHTIRMTQCETYVVTAAIKSRDIRVWNIKKGLEVFKLDCDSEVRFLFLCCGDKFIVAIDDIGEMKVFSTEIGELQYKQNLLEYQEKGADIHGMCTVFQKSTHIAISLAKRIQFFDVQQKNYIKQSITAKWIDSQNHRLLTGAQNVICGIGRREKYLHVYELLDDDQQYTHVSMEVSIDCINGIALSPSAKTVLVYGYGAEVLLLDNKQTHSFKGLFQSVNFVNESLFVGIVDYECVAIGDTGKKWLTGVLYEAADEVVAAKDLTTFATAGKYPQPLVKVWKPDIIQNKKTKINHNGTRIQGKELIRSIVTVPESSRYIILITTDDADSYVKLCDVYKNVILRTSRFSGVKLYEARYISPKKMLVCDQYSKLHLFGLADMRVENTLQGFVGSTDFFIRENGEEVVCLTKWRCNLKLVRISSTRTTEIIKSQFQKRIKKLLVNEDGSVAVIEEETREEINVNIISLQRKQVIHKLTREHADLRGLAVSKRYVLICEESGTVRNWSVRVWDFSGQMLKKIDVAEFAEVLLLERNSPKLVTAAEDVQVFDILKGELEYTITTRFDSWWLTAAKDTVEEVGKYGLTSDRYNVLLFDLANGENVKRFRIDHEWDHYVMVDNYTVVGATHGDETEPSLKIHVLKLDRGVSVKLTPEPNVLFEQDDNTMQITLEKADIRVQESDDPDIDVAPPSDHPLSKLHRYD